MGYNEVDGRKDVRLILELLSRILVLMFRPRVWLDYSGLAKEGFLLIL